MLKKLVYGFLGAALLSGTVLFVLDTLSAERIALTIFVAVLGAFLASFLDVVADRLPQGKSLSGRSHCENCERQLGFLDLIPIVSWLVLRGRCRTCKEQIPARHFAIETFLAVMFGIAAWTLADPIDGLALSGAEGWELAFRLLMLSALTVVIVADLRFFIIPDEVSLGLIALLLFLHTAALVFDTPYEHVLPTLKLALMGAGFGVVFLGAFSLVSHGTWMGWGDVKLAGALGLAYGFPAIMFILPFSFILGAVVALVMIAIKIRTMKDMLPFGPFIALAAFPFLFRFDMGIYTILGVADLIKPLL